MHLLVNGRVKLRDFGLARVAKAAPLTVTGAVIGTAYYMSPEQVKGLAVCRARLRATVKRMRRSPSQ